MTGSTAVGATDPLGLSGVVPPTITAFTESEDVNYEATVAHARFVVEGGVHGVFPLGTNGEFALLTGEERRGIVEAVCDGIDEVPVVPGVGAPSTRETVAHADHAEAAGADGVIVVTPFYYPLDDRGAVDHYRAVAAAVDVPVYVYHIPSRTGNALSLSALEAIAAIDGVAGLKDSSKDVPWLARAVDRVPELTYLVGSDSLLVPGLDAGCAGMVSAVANAFPELVVDLYEAYDAGDETRARKLQSTVYDARDAIKDGPYMAGVKTALSLRDLDFEPGPLRSPLRRMDADATDRLERRLTDLDLL
ncbi:dihydrodipicolinate synthase family protein [Halorientalis marina]|uniref:dihydrodipicolinate synthase family protein n=1 Tax=Halorientalis marina TaxID=2931976 RepID=UPI001FF6D303|nr:dihydrodipicolinate synthase family protein [Halorientalis marina]